MTSDVRTCDGTHSSEVSFSGDGIATRRSTVPRVRANAREKMLTSDAGHGQRHFTTVTMWCRTTSTIYAVPSEVRRAENRSSRSNFRRTSAYGAGCIRWKSPQLATCARDRSVESRSSNRRGIRSAARLRRRIRAVIYGGTNQAESIFGDVTIAGSLRERFTRRRRAATGDGLSQPENSFATLPSLMRATSPCLVARAPGTVHSRRDARAA